MKAYRSHQTPATTPSFIGTGIGSISRRVHIARQPLISPRPVHRHAQRSFLTMSQKMLHAVYRVGDLEATSKFLEALGMKRLRYRDVPSEKYSNAFFGYGPEQKGEYFSLELTYNYGVDSYDIGTGFGHFGVAVEDASAVVERVREAGFKVCREVGPVKGKLSRVCSSCSIQRRIPCDWFFFFFLSASCIRNGR